jgi:hypothetical protein
MLQVDRRAKLRLQQLGVIERSGHAVASRNDQRRRIVGECRNELGAPVASPSFNSVRPPRSLSCSNFSQSFPATARAISQVMSGSPWSTRHTTGARGCVVCPPDPIMRSKRGFSGSTVSVRVGRHAVEVTERFEAKCRPPSGVASHYDFG